MKPSEKKYISITGFSGKYCRNTPCSESRVGATKAAIRPWIRPVGADQN
jgi:hypothetical protein